MLKKRVTLGIETAIVTAVCLLAFESTHAGGLSFVFCASGPSLPKCTYDIQIPGNADFAIWTYRIFFNGSPIADEDGWGEYYVPLVAENTAIIGVTCRSLGGYWTIEGWADNYASGSSSGPVLKSHSGPAGGFYPATAPTC